MNEYLTKLDLPVSIDIDFEKYLAINRPQISVKSDIVPVELVELLNKFGLTIQWMEVFVLRPGQSHPVHTDGPEIDSKAKFNYVVGGAGSKMIWYETNGNTVRHHTTKTGNKCLMAIDQDNVVPVYEEPVLGFIIAKVGVLHTVVNPTELRYCMSIALSDSITNKRLMYEEVVERLKEFAV